MEVTPAAINQALSSATKGDKPALEDLAKKIDLSRCVDRYGATLIHYAARAGKTNTISWLVQTVGLSGSKQANNGATPAHDAAATGQLESLQWLIQYGGCDPNSKDTSLATPLHLAARFNKVSVVIWLVESGKCNVLEKAKGGIIPLHLASAKGSMETVRWLSQHNSSTVNRRADNGATPLYFAAQEGHLDCLKFLANQAEANCRLRASDGMAPIHAAAQMGKLDCLVWLVEECKIPITERDNDGATPVHYAAARGHLNVLKWLLTHNAGIEKDDLGGTPLHDAAEHGQLDAIKLLLSFDADPQVRDSDGLTPADLAEECNFKECASYLRNQPFQQPSDLPVKKVEHDSTQSFTASLVQSAIELNKKSNSPISPRSSFNPHHHSEPHRETKHQFQMRKLTIPAVQGAEKAESSCSELSNLFQRMSNQPVDGSTLESDDRTIMKVQDPQLLDEVRHFDKSTLESTPVLKRNLQPFKFGKVVKNPVVYPQSSPKVISTAKDSPVSHNNVVESEDLLSTAQSPQDKSKTNMQEETDKVPLWRRNLMRKRQKEQEQSQKEKMEKEEKEKNRWADVPEWKISILMKKEEERAKQKAIEDEKRKKDEEEQQKFDALPEWKKNIIIRKRETKN